MFLTLMCFGGRHFVVDFFSHLSFTVSYCSGCLTLLEILDIYRNYFSCCKSWKFASLVREFARLSIHFYSCHWQRHNSTLAHGSQSSSNAGSESMSHSSIDKQSLADTGLSGSGYTKYRENRRHKCHENQSI